MLLLAKKHGRLECQLCLLLTDERVRFVPECTAFLAYLADKKLAVRGNITLDGTSGVLIAVHTVADDDGVLGSVFGNNLFAADNSADRGCWRLIGVARSVRSVG